MAARGGAPVVRRQDLPRSWRVGHRAERHPRAGSALVDATAPGGGPSNSREGPLSRTKFLKRVRALAHVDDPAGNALPRLLSRGDPDYDEHSRAEQRLRACCSSPCGQMVAASRRTKKDSGSAGGRQRATKCRPSSISHSTRHATPRAPVTSWPVPLRVHARYQREEILGALDFPRKPNSMREGVCSGAERRLLPGHVSRSPRPTTHLTTMYARLSHLANALPLGIAVDYFGESPEAAGDISRREHRPAVRPLRAQGRASEPRPICSLDLPFTSHAGDRPIAITWRLEHPMPAEFFARPLRVAV